MPRCASGCFSSKPEVDLYGILGLQKGASGEEIKTAYRRLAKELHPDLGHRDEATAERFRQVSHAHNTLLHVGMRRMYDLQLRRKEAAERCRHLESQETAVFMKISDHFMCFAWVLPGFWVKIQLILIDFH